MADFVTIIGIFSTFMNQHFIQFALLWIQFISVSVTCAISCCFVVDMQFIGTENQEKYTVMTHQSIFDFFVRRKWKWQEDKVTFEICERC